MLLDSHLFPLAASRQITGARLRKHTLNLRRVVSVALLIVLLAGSPPPAMANSLLRGTLVQAHEKASSLAGLAVKLAQKVLVSISSHGPEGLALKGGLRSLGLSSMRSSSQGLGDNRGVRPRPPESRAEKEARAATLRINPGGEVMLQSRQPMVFAAIPLDIEGTPIHGLPAEWESSDKQVVFVKKNGQAVAGKPGSATLTARAGGIKEIVRIVVVEGTKENFGGKKKQNSIRSRQRRGQNSGNVNLVNPVARNTVAGTKRQQTLRFSTGSRNGIERLAVARASAQAQAGKPQAKMPMLRSAFLASPLPLRPPNEDPLPDDETNSLYQADNAVGSPPGKRKAGALTPAAATAGTESGNQNFTFALPVAGLGGRGLDVSLSLVYNSQVFNKSTDSFDNSTWMSYDVDSGWPAPGFRLGFGQIEDQGSFGFTLTDADGTRHALTYTSAFNYDTTDGTFIHFTGGSGWGTLFYPDGTRVSYGAAGGGIRSYPTQITDRNGNYILISYVNGVGPKISLIEDTLQRYVRFYYASNGDLVTITAPGLTGDLQVMRFYYHDVSIPQSGLFASGVNVSGAPVSVHTLKYIYLPSSVETNGAHIGYRYDYNVYGMMYQIRQFRGMAVDSASTSSPGSVTSEGSQAALTNYDYPTSASNLSDVPTYLHRTDDWAGRTTGMNGDPSAAPYYTFSTSQQTGEKISTVTAPDETINETHTKDAPGQWDDGLMQQTIVKHGSATLAKTVIDWEQTPNSGPPRVATVRVTNDGNPAQTKATVLSYTSFNNVSAVSERDFTTDGLVSSAELRRTEITYVTSSNYINRHLLHLQSTVKVFASGSPTPSSRTDFAYDAYGASHANLTGRDDIIMHDPAFDPFQPLQENCEWQCMNWQFIDGLEQCVDWQWVCNSYTPYDPSTDYRGNVTSVVTYPDASSASGTITHSTTYDIAGNVMTAQVDCCQQKTFTYSGAGPSGNHDYAYSISITSGSGGTTLTASVSYDYNTGLVATITDENNQQASNSYYPSSLRLSEVDYPDGGQTSFTYNDGLSADANGKHHFYSEISTKLDAPGDSPRYVNSRRYFDGRGAVARTFDNYTTANGWSTQDIEYDVMGRAYRASNPYYSSGSNSSINPDGFWTTSTFDQLGRATQVTMPRGDENNTLTTTVQIGYAGTVTAATDQAGKQRRQITDALGRVIRLDEPDASGNLGNVDTPAQATSYEYDALGNLIHIAQGAQHRFFKYDSLSRLTHEKQVEQDAPWTTSDSVAGNNQWSRKIIYNSNSLVTDAYDARQRRTQFIYDGLNRVSQIAYLLANGSPDPATPAAFYFYDSQTLPSGAPSFNRGYSAGRLVAMTYGTATSTTGNYFGYDSRGRVLTQKQVTGSTTYSLSYAYNYAGLLMGETYPTSRALSYSYDEGARLSSVSDGTTTFDNSFSYTAHGGLTSETFGNGMVHALEYNRRLQASKITLKQNSSATTPLQQYDYGYGQFNSSTGAVDTSKNNGQIGKVVGTIGTTTQWLQGFSYDSIGRLSNVAEYQGGSMNSQTYSQGYTYDRYGNRFQISNTTLGLPAVSSSEIETSTNRFISSGSTPTTYDPAGNILSDAKFRGMNYSYDANNRQTFAERSDHTNQQTSVYDCAGQRVQTTANGTTRTMIYDIFGQNVVEYSNGSLERENIYRGGQLLAVSEPLIAAAAAPSELVAAPSDGGVSITLSWSAAAGATNYRVTRATNKDGPYQLVGTTSSTGLTDTGVSGGNAYLYKVCAADSQGNCTSGYSNIAMSATVAFPTDPTITTFAENPANATPIKAAHITELRTAVNAVRHLAGMSDATWTHPTLTPVVSVISADDVRDLRNKLDEALTALRIPTSAYTDQTLAGAPNGTLIKRAHITELRQRATRGISPCYKTITQFVADFYQGALHRQPSSSESSSWTATLTQAQAQGEAQLIAAAQSLGNTLFTSAEYGNLNTSNAQFITDLYAGFLQRTPDTSGYNFWLGVLNGPPPDTRAHLILAFAVSTEFQENVKALCWAAGTSGGLRYVLSDLQGSTRAVMNNNGSSSSIIARHDYLPFGEETSAGMGLRTAGQGYGAVDTNRLKYGLLERDASTGLDHTWWRKYESFAGRWTSPDPYGGSGTTDNPQSFNRYSYTQNDPVNSVDPSGLMACFGYHVFLIHLEDGKVTGVDYLGFIPVFCWDDGPIGGDPGGGGPGGGNPQVGQRSHHAQKKQSDCANFVDYLVNEAYGDRIFGRLAVGRFFGANVTLNNKLGVYKSLPTSGFKEEYIDNQGGWAMAHIEGIAGAYLIGKNKLVPGGSQTGEQRAAQQFNEDMGQMKTALMNGDLRSIAERNSEINDDIAGLAVGKILGGVIDGKISKQDARKAIFNMLCNH